jgi:hypothetical protein
MVLEKRSQWFVDEFEYYWIPVLWMGMRSLDPSNMFFMDWIQLSFMDQIQLSFTRFFSQWLCLQINSQAAFLDWRQDWAIGPEFLQSNTCKCRKLKQNPMSHVRSFITFIVHFDGVTISTNFSSFLPIETRTWRCQRHLNLIWESR